MKRLAITLALFAALALTGASSAQTEVQKQKQAIADQIEALQKQFDKLQAKDAPPAPKKDGAPPKFKTGAKRTPLPKIMEAMRTGKLAVHKASGRALPASVTMVPPKLSMLGNDQYGDCVTAESCFSMEAFSVYSGLPEIVINDADAIAWASSHGFLNGADLLSVIQAMQADGIKDSTGTLRKAGTPATVDYTVEATLQSAIAIGPVSIGIDSTALPSGAGNASGWSAFGGSPQQFTNEDHDVDVCGFGDAKTLFGVLNTPVPANAPTTGTLYLVYTWSTIGVVDHAWIMSTVGEAYVRNPTVVGLTPPTPPPPPTPVTVAVADVAGTVGQAVTFQPQASGGTGPYKFGYTYGDGSPSDGTGTHAYAAAGTYTVSVTCSDSSGLFGSATCKATIGSGPTPPNPTAPTITLTTDLPAGAYYVVPAKIGDLRLIDLITQQQPQRPALTPAQQDAIRVLEDLLKDNRKK
jgi:PKD repeat protein